MIRLFLFLLLVGCKPKEPKTSFKGIAMTIPYQITIAKKLSKQEQTDISYLIYETFTHIDQVFNPWNPDSEISKFNQSQSTDWIHTSESLSRFLQKCEKYVELTENLFDPTVGSIIGKWKQSLQKHQSPSDIREAVGFEHITVLPKKIKKDDPSCQIDLCGVCKGYAVDLLVEKLSALNYQNLCVNWGGEIRCLGSPSPKRDWKLQIVIADSEPLPKGCEYIFLNNRSIASSGKFMPYQWKADKKSYYHIFNPKHKKPMSDHKNQVSSVSVIAPNCALADALATACMSIESIDQAKKWAENIVRNDPDIIFYIFNPKQKIFMKVEEKGTLFFDIGNVLLKFNYEKMLRQMASLCFLSTDELHHFFLDHPYPLQYELGQITSQQFFHRIQLVSKKRLNYLDLAFAASDVFEEMPNMAFLIESLKKLGHTLVLLSNTNEIHFSFIKKHYPILAQFDHKILSYEAGLRKPDPKIFIKSLEFSKNSFNFYTDDLEENIVSAKKTGLDASQFINVKELEQTLKQKNFLT